MSRGLFARDISPRPDLGSPNQDAGRPKSTSSVETGLIRETLLGILVSVLTAFWLQAMALHPDSSREPLAAGSASVEGSWRSTPVQLNG
jgi:hypothetical protein